MVDVKFERSREYQHAMGKSLHINDSSCPDCASQDRRTRLGRPQAAAHADGRERSNVPRGVGIDRRPLTTGRGRLTLLMAPTTVRGGRRLFSRADGAVEDCGWGGRRLQPKLAWRPKATHRGGRRVFPRVEDCQMSLTTIQNVSVRRRWEQKVGF